MKRLNELIDRVGNLASEGVGLRLLYPALQRFFSREDVQRKLIEFNQRHMFDTQTNRNGQVIGTYVPKVASHKRKVGLPSVNYSFYETGAYFSCMGVMAREEDVEVIADTHHGLGMDVINHRGVQPSPNGSSLAYMFNRYDPQRTSLGVTDDNFDNFVETSGIKSNLITEIDEYLDGKNTY